MRTRLMLICVGVLLVAQVRAQAYTDPGSGTLIWQMLLAAAFGLMFYVRRLVGWVQRVRSVRVKTRSPHVGATRFEEPDSMND